MDPQTQQMIKKRFAELPQEVRQAILSPSLRTNLQAVGDRHGLHIDQVGELENTTILVMAGIVDAAQFPEALREKLAVDDDGAVAIAEDVAEHVFEPIRGAMQKFMEAEQEAREEKLGAIPTPAIPVGASPTPGAVRAPASIPPSPPQPTPLSQAGIPEKAPEIHPADMALAHPTSTMAKTVTVGIPPAKTPGSARAEAKKYTADPYREPIG